MSFHSKLPILNLAHLGTYQRRTCSKQYTGLSRRELLIILLLLQVCWNISYLIILGAFDAFCKVLEKRSSFIAKFSERHPLQERRNWDAFLKLVS